MAENEEHYKEDFEPLESQGDLKAESVGKSQLTDLQSSSSKLKIDTSYPTSMMTSDPNTPQTEVTKIAQGQNSPQERVATKEKQQHIVDDKEQFQTKDNIIKQQVNKNENTQVTKPQDSVVKDNIAKEQRIEQFQISTLKEPIQDLQTDKKQGIDPAITKNTSKDQEIPLQKKLSKDQEIKSGSNLQKQPQPAQQEQQADIKIGSNTLNQPSHQTKENLLSKSPSKDQEVKAADLHKHAAKESEIKSGSNLLNTSLIGQDIKTEQQVQDLASKNKGPGQAELAPEQVSQDKVSPNQKVSEAKSDILSNIQGTLKSATEKLQDSFKNSLTRKQVAQNSQIENQTEIMQPQHIPTDELHPDTQTTLPDTNKQQQQQASQKLEPINDNAVIDGIKQDQMLHNAEQVNDNAKDQNLQGSLDKPTHNMASSISSHPAQTLVQEAVLVQQVVTPQQVTQQQVPTQQGTSTIQQQGLPSAQPQLPAQEASHSQKQSIVIDENQNQAMIIEDSKPSMLENPGDLGPNLQQQIYSHRPQTTPSYPQLIPLSPVISDPTFRSNRSKSPPTIRPSSTYITPKGRVIKGQDVINSINRLSQRSSSYLKNESVSDLQKIIERLNFKEAQELGAPLPLKMTEEEIQETVQRLFTTNKEKYQPPPRIRSARLTFKKDVNGYIEQYSDIPFKSVEARTEMLCKLYARCREQNSKKMEELKATYLKPLTNCKRYVGKKNADLERVVQRLYEGQGSK